MWGSSANIACLSHSYQQDIIGHAIQCDRRGRIKLIVIKTDKAIF